MTKSELYNMSISDLIRCDETSVESELFHAGVKGMKWGKRKARPVRTGIRRSGQKESSTTDESARKAVRKQKAVKAVKIGAAVAGTALVAYGAYKVTKFVKNRKRKAAPYSIKITEPMPRQVNPTDEFNQRARNAYQKKREVEYYKSWKNPYGDKYDW